MNATRTKNLFIEALSLPTRSRASLVHKLLISLEQDEASREIEAAWNQEAKKRYKAFKKGKIRARPAEDVMSDAIKRPS